MGMVLLVPFLGHVGDVAKSIQIVFLEGHYSRAGCRFTMKTFHGVAFGGGRVGDHLLVLLGGSGVPEGCVCLPPFTVRRFRVVTIGQPVAVRCSLRFLMFTGERRQCL